VALPVKALSLEDRSRSPPMLSYPAADRFNQLPLVIPSMPDLLVGLREEVPIPWHVCSSRYTSATQPSSFAGYVCRGPHSFPDNNCSSPPHPCISSSFSHDTERWSYTPTFRVPWAAFGLLISVLNDKSRLPPSSSDGPRVAAVYE